MADNTPQITFEVHRGDEVTTTSFDDPSVTIGSGPAAMLTIEDESVAELHAVVNVEDDGSIQLLHLGSESGTKLNGKEIANAPLTDGDEVECGSVRIVVKLVAAEAAAAAPAPEAEAAAAEPADDSATAVEDAAVVEAAQEEAAQEEAEAEASEEAAAAAPVEEGDAISAGAAADVPEDDDVTEAGEEEELAAASADADPNTLPPLEDPEDIDPETYTEDIMAFVMRSGTSKTSLGVDTKRAKVLEVNQIWGSHLLDSKHYGRGSKPVTIGSSVGWKWNFLGVDVGWVPAPLHLVLPWFPPMWSEVVGDWRNDFYAPDSNLPGGRDHVMFHWKGSQPVAAVSQDWDGFVDVDDQRFSFDELISAGKASKSGTVVNIPLEDATRLMVDVDGVIFFAQQVPAGKKVIAGMSDDVDYPFLAILSAAAFIGLMFGLLMYTATPPAQNAMVEIPDRFVELLLEKPEVDKDKGKKPKANPDAGEGAKAKREEGKVGKKDAKMQKAKGNKVEIRKQELDRQIAENAGVLGALRDGAELDGVFGNSGLNADIAGGIGGLLGAKGTQIGSGGLGSRGSGFGGGGTAEGLGGLGTKGIGSGSSGFGSGGGNFGAKGDGAISAVGGDPIILGALDKALIDEVVKRHMNQIKYCYQRELNKNPNLGGKIVIKFVIAKDGSVSSASVGATTMSNAGVENCVVGRFLRMQFPQPKGGGIVIVRYPFVFGS